MSAGRSGLVAALGILGITIAIQALQSMAVLAVPVLMPAAAVSLGIGVHWAGSFTAIVYGSAMLGSLATAGSVSRFGALTICIACILLTAIGLAVTGMAGLLVLLAGAVLMGLGYGPITAACSDILARRIPPGWFGLVFSLKQTGVPIGFAAAGAIVPALVVAFGWRAAVVAIAGAMAVAALAMLPFRSRLDGERRAGAGRAARAPIALVLQHRQLRLLAIASIAYLVPQSCLGSFLVVFLVERAELSLAAAGLILSLTQGVGTVIRVVWGAVADRLAERLSLLGALGLIMGAGALLTAQAGMGWSFAAIAAAASLYSAGAVGWNGVLLAELARWAPPGQAAAVTGAATAITFFGAVIGPVGFGLLRVASGGYGLGFWVLAAGAIVTGLALIAEGLRLRRR